MARLGTDADLRSADGERTAHLLIVDDEPTAVNTLAALLPGYRFEVATGGAEALAHLEHRPVDLVLSDVMMPEMDGFELCARIKAHPTLRYIPVILVTALDSQHDMVRGIDAGADEFLRKPVQRLLVQTRVRAMLRLRARYDELRHSDVDVLVRERRESLIRAAGLSMRERDVLELLLLARSYAEIGQLLGMSPRTARFHQTNILTKLGAESRLDLLRLFT